MVERAQAKRALERLVVHRDKFKSGAKSLKSTQRSVNGMEIMKVLLDEDEVAASCTAGKTVGLEQEVLDSIQGCPEIIRNHVLDTMFCKYKDQVNPRSWYVSI